MNYALIMAGGAGTRLWPLSRERLPKPALRLYSDQSMFQIAVERLSPLFAPEQILVIAGAEHIGVLAEQVPDIPAENYIVEPQGRGTAPAIGLAAVHLAARDPEAAMVVLTADHHIGNTAVFRSAIAAALDIAQNDYLVTLGITPSWPSTDYGYIEQAEPLGALFGGLKAYRAARFVEKPNENVAKKMLALGNYAWNSGMFIWKISAILAEFRAQMPELYDVLMKIGEELKTGNYQQILNALWPTIAKQTIDYGIMEHARRVVVVPVDMDWMDVGTWTSLKALLPQDPDGNSTRGEVLLEDSHGSLILGGERLIAGIGLDDLIVVDTPDALLICPKNQVGEVRKLVARLKDSGRTDLV
jgi:mannose-1-phosphate guanylyltransferase